MGASHSSSSSSSRTSGRGALWCHWGLHLAEEIPAPDRARRSVRDALATILGLAVFPAFASSLGMGNSLQPSLVGPFHTCGNSSISVDFLHNISDVLSDVYPRCAGYEISTPLTSGAGKGRNCRSIGCRPTPSAGPFPEAVDGCSDWNSNVAAHSEGSKGGGVTSSHDPCLHGKRGEADGRRGEEAEHLVRKEQGLGSEKTENGGSFAWVQAPPYLWPEGTVANDASSVDTPMKEVLVNERRTWLRVSEHQRRRRRGVTWLAREEGDRRGRERDPGEERQDGGRRIERKRSSFLRQPLLVCCDGHERCHDTSDSESKSSSSWTDSDSRHRSGGRVRGTRVPSGRVHRPEKRRERGEKEASMMLQPEGEEEQAGKEPSLVTRESLDEDTTEEEEPESSMALLKLHVLDLRLPTRLNGKKGKKSQTSISSCNTKRA